MRTKEGLDDFKRAIDKEAKLKTLGVTKVTKPRKNRLILFGAPEDIADGEFKGELEGIEEVSGHEIDIKKSFPNRNGTKDYIIDADNHTSNALLDRSRIIINFNRVRGQKYISINRCYKYQKFGHVAYSCKGRIACGGSHDTRNCEKRTLIGVSIGHRTHTVQTPKTARRT
ncbi:hypothetical protein JTE90_011560 [Oedothorax gibbosus]|uniref:Uncharacterized protein n=1 Tax=Oedothorax gibbosus TaxID=931172 RepID=A0AAV6TFX7_9ARAC|nr:hypothetical protein JTE90_011560 [Oedothorax gibbosus]